jgi:hypothetical protein
MPRTGPRPHIRKYPDPVDNKLYLDWAKARAQAHYLGETWNLTTDEYIALWREQDRYLNKGRHNDQWCLVRKNYDEPWQLANVEVITRLAHYQISACKKTGKFRKRKKENVE